MSRKTTVLAQRTWLYLALACLWIAPGCDLLGGDDGTDPAPADDVPAVTGDVVTGPLPDLTVVIVPTATEGNAPLTVGFVAEVGGGVSDEDVTYLWSVDGVSDGTEATYERSWFVAATSTVGLTVTYQAEDGGSVTAQDEVVIRVESCADLTFSTLTVAPPVDVAPGDTITLSKGALLNDDGGLIKGTFAVRVYLSSDDIVDESDIVLETISYDGMASGEATESIQDLVGYQLTVPGDTPDGNYYVIFVADPAEVVNECQETNNVVKTTNNITVDAQAAFKPDLVVTEVDFLFPDGTIKHQGEQVPYEFTIANEGAGVGESFPFAVYVSSDQTLSADDIVVTAPGDLGASVQSMDPGDDKGFFNAWTLPESLPDGAYWLIVVVDPNDGTAEEDDDNNVTVSSGSFVMEFELPQCTNLRLDSLIVSPNASYWGGTLTLSATVTNDGSQDTPSNWVMRGYLSLQESLNPATSSDSVSWSVPPIPAGETHVIDKLFPIDSGLPVLDYWVGVQLDPDGALNECTEGDNAAVYENPISLSSTASVDVTAADVQFHPGSVVAGHDIKVTYKVGNDGSSSSSSFNVVVVLSQDMVVNASQALSGIDLIVYEGIVTYVDAGTEIERVDKVTIPAALDHNIGSYYVGVIADVDNNQLSDNQKSNNSAVSASPLTVIDPQGGCFEDDFEPNNGSATPTEIEAGVLSGLGSCGDEDWFAVNVPAGHSLIVDLEAQPILNLTPVPSDVDLQLLDSNGDTIDVSTKVGAVDSVHIYAVEKEETYRIRVFGKAPNVEAAYSLSVDVRAPVDGVDLIIGSVQALPSILYPGGVMSLSWSEVNLGVQGGGDHVSTVYLSRQAEWDPDDAITLTSAGMGAIAGQGQIQGDLEAQLPEDLEGGYWYFHVMVDDGDVVTEAFEDNNVGVSDVVFLDAQLTCTEDELEPNNDAAIATPVTLAGAAVSMSNLTVCPKLDDWYAVDLWEGTTFTATVTYPYESDHGKLTVEIWDPTAGTVLLKDTQPNQSKVVLPWVWTAGTYYVRVGNQAVGGDSAPYAYMLTMSAVAGDPDDACSPDVFEPNDSLSDAAVLGCGAQTATLCKGEPDIYRIDASAGDALSIDLQHPDDQLKMALFNDPDDSALASSAGNGSLGYTVTLDGTYYLYVERKSGVSATQQDAVDYVLTVDGVDGTDLVVEGASLLFSSVYNGDDNLFDFSVSNTCVGAAASFTTTVWMSIDDTLDSSDVWLEDVNVDGVAAKSSVALSEKVTIPYSTAPGNYFLIVEADSGAAIDESNEANNVASVVQTVEALCLPDSLEPNDVLMPSAPYAPLVVPPGVSSLALCPFEIDWFAVELSAGSTLTATISFSQAEGDLDLRLYDPGWSTTIPLLTGDTGDDNETLVYEAAVPSTVLLHVRGFNGASAAYDLQVSVD